jgi:hypothetical protein
MITNVPLLAVDTAAFDATIHTRYAITALDSAVNKPYIIVHYLAGASSTGLGANVVKELLALGDDRYSRNLQKVFAVHGTTLGKVSGFFTSIFAASPARSKTVHLEKGLRDLFEVRFNTRACLFVCVTVCVCVCVCACAHVCSRTRVLTTRPVTRADGGRRASGRAVVCVGARREAIWSYELADGIHLQAEGYRWRALTISYDLRRSLTICDDRLRSATIS